MRVNGSVGRIAVVRAVVDEGLKPFTAADERSRNSAGAVRNARNPRVATIRLVDALPADPPGTTQNVGSEPHNDNNFFLIVRISAILSFRRSGRFAFGRASG